jgi:hypothetical protein
MTKGWGTQFIFLRRLPLFGKCRKVSQRRIARQIFTQGG